MTLKVVVGIRSPPVVWMAVTPIRIALPDLDAGILQWSTVDIQDAAAEVGDLS